jgi:hypothetical protein
MHRVLATLVLLALPLAGATIRLYLKDGNFHVVREYEVQGDRVRYYSLERSEWEEVPLELVDLDRTKAELRAREQERRQELEWLTGEEEAERSERREVARVPAGRGVYLVEGNQLRPLAQAELEVISSKKRTVLKVITPVPIVAGKATVVIKGERSATVVTDPTPQFYFRLGRLQRFALLRLKPRKDLREVERWAVAPVTNEIFEEHDEVEIFRREMASGLYKLWPKAPLEPGEYAVAEFSPGEGNIEVWDFSLRPAK